MDRALERRGGGIGAIRLAGLVGLVASVGLLGLVASTRAAGPTKVAQTLAKVSQVIDGDSLVVELQGALPGAKPQMVRIQNIDAPEICQSWGRQAREALAEQVKGKVVALKGKARDSHGRWLATVALENQDVGSWMVAEGHAWSIRTQWDRGPLVKQERMAYALSRGLWGAGGKAQAPKEFRRENGPCPQG